MTLGDIFEKAAKENKDYAGAMNYKEWISEDKFNIKFSHPKWTEASISCSVPYTGLEEEKNYLRLHFLSMCMNAAIHGMKRMKHQKKKK